MIFWTCNEEGGSLIWGGALLSCDMGDAIVLDLLPPGRGPWTVLWRRGEDGVGRGRMSAGLGGFIEVTRRFRGVVASCP